MDDYECDFDELDKLISQEVTKGPLNDYENEESIDSKTVLEGAYSKIAFYSETTWWDQEEVDEYRVNNLGLWSAVMGCDQCKWNQNIPVNEQLTEADENCSEPKKMMDLEEIDNNDSGNWLKTTPWPASLLKLYPQIPDAVASKNVSIFSHFHSTFAGDLLYSKIGNVKELIQYNRLKQDYIKNLWNDIPPFEDLLNLNLEDPPETKENVVVEDDITEKDEINFDDKLSTINEICDSFNAIISQKNMPVLKGEIKSDKLELKIKLLERKKTLYDFQKEFENVFNGLPSSLSSKDEFQNQGNQCKKLKTDNVEYSYTRKSYCSKNKNSQTEVTKKSYKLSEKSSNLIKENFGSFPINQVSGEIIETLEEVCQWLHNVYPHKTRDEYLSAVTEQSNSWTDKASRDTAQTSTELIPARKKNGTKSQIKKILPRPTNVSDFSSQIFSQIPSKRLYRDVLTNSEVQSCLEADPVNKYAELEREAIEQYSGCSINSENSIALLHMDEDSKFKDLEREAIEQYQPEEDSVITSGELFTSSELIKQSPIGTPPKVNSSTQVNIFEFKIENKLENNCHSCQALCQSSSEYLLCSDSQPDGIDNLFTEDDIMNFEKNKFSSHTSLSPNKKCLRNDFETSIRSLKHLQTKESTPLVDIYEPLLTSKTLTYTSPYDSPTEDLQSEDCTSKIVKFILKKNLQEFSEEETYIDCCDNAKTLLKSGEMKVDERNQESTSKAKESDEDKSRQDDSKKKKKKKRRSRKKKGTKKDGGGRGGGGGGGNTRGGGRCDARTPIHCPIPLSTKTSESKIKRKEDLTKKEKKDVADNSILYKWQRLSNILTKLVKDTGDRQKKGTTDELLYDEYYLEQLSIDRSVNVSLPHHFLKSIPFLNFVSQFETRTSVLMDFTYYKLQRWGWSFISSNDLFTKCLQNCCFNKSEPFPSWLNWCKCFTLRVGHNHAISPGSILLTEKWRIQEGDIFNPKYWGLPGNGMFQGVVVNLGKQFSVHNLINTLISSNNNNQMKYKYDSNEDHFSINQCKYFFELCSQKIYHVCNSSSINLNTEVLNLQKKTQARNKFHRGKNHKIKGKTFCYYCSGNSFKNYTLHTFFCEVDAQNKGAIVDKEKIVNQPSKKTRANTSMSSKYQQTEVSAEDLISEQGEDNPNRLSFKNFIIDNSDRYLNKGCYKCQTDFECQNDLMKHDILQGIEHNQIDIETPIVSAKDVTSFGVSYCAENQDFQSLHNFKLTDSNNYAGISKSFRKTLSGHEEQNHFINNFNISKNYQDSKTKSLDYLYKHENENDFFKNLSNMSFEGLGLDKNMEMKIDKESNISDNDLKNAGNMDKACKSGNAILSEAEEHLKKELTDDSEDD